MYIQNELSIKSMTISQIFTLYNDNKLVVNRRYQRKLCWSIEEKRNFIDTIEKGLPVPMFLFAVNDVGQYEIIDGMQRLDAICSFISQKYKLKDGYFDLESMPDTLELVRNNKINQKRPIINASLCKNIANYPLPVSIFPATNSEDVEEIFKRINSTGKHLALQELRQVNVDTLFATIVRKLSSEIRGDVSENILFLKDMANISLSNHRLKYSIFIDDIFWVKNGIINNSEIRQSRDEEAIAYIIATMILPKESQVLLNSLYLNKLYGYSPNPLDQEIPIEMTAINNAIDRIGVSAVKKQFEIVFSCIEEMLNMAGKSFRQLLKAPGNVSDWIIPFSIIFMAIHKLMISEKKYNVNYKLLAQKLDGNCSYIIGPGMKGADAINSIYGLIQVAFSKGKNDDPALDDWSLELINILNQSRTEQVQYDFKIGFVPFGDTSLDTRTIDQVLKTLTAINNCGANKTGYVIIGVADKIEDAKKYQSLSGIKYTLVNELALCGIDRDAKLLSLSIDRYTHSIKEYINNSKDISEAYKMHLLTNMKVPMAYGKHVIVFKTCFNEPVTFGNDYYLREFTDVHRMTNIQIPTLFSNYYGKQKSDK